MSDLSVLDRPTPASGEKTVYIAAISAAEIFADHTYQRELDSARAKSMAAEWDPRLAGVIDVADRGLDCPSGRQYAVINGQHRWAAAELIDPNKALVANIHTGLTVEDEAKLFYDIDAKTRRLTGWDRWKSRRGAADPAVVTIERIVESAGLRVDSAPADGNIRCVSTLEKILGAGGELLLENTLLLIVEIWGRRLDAVDAPLVGGLALMLSTYSDINLDRLADVLVDLAPRQIKARAMALRETQSGQVAKLAALVMVSAYNSARARGHRLDPAQLVRLRKLATAEGAR